jgi:hypothetical protein
LQDRADRVFEEKIQQSKEIIEEGEEDDVNPWLSRTKWHKYLKKPSPTDMIASVAAPSTDPEKPEPYETVIWKACPRQGCFSPVFSNRITIKGLVVWLALCRLK